MGRLKSKKVNQTRRSNRVRKTLSGNTELNRLSVFVSNKNVSAQIIDDNAGKTLVSASSVSLKTTGNMTETAKTIGGEIAKKAKAKKISKVKLDRGTKLYHGRIKAFADAAREGGLKF
ncbi:MAG TPA: 50S ribosomal protein L18 [Candidatus Saccharimonadales bacterium]|nr:50S ribosomal protein L18 [Candidatus Saccharimonadales bacterium]